MQTRKVFSWVIASLRLHSHPLTLACPHTISCTKFLRPLPLVTNAKTRARGEHARSNVHGKKFLEQELGGVRDMDLRDARLVVTWAAFVLALLELSVWC
jgi:hypothetical protein